jgi:hypothetical protein
VVASLRAARAVLVGGDGTVIVHTFPVNDLVEHDTEGDDCVCGPTLEPVERDDGSFGWLISHHALDGRE